MTEYFKASHELQRMPTTRAAYSDRSAWMMSEMSALAYLPFGGDNRFKAILSAIGQAAKYALKREGESELSNHFQALEKTLKGYIDQQLGNKSSEGIVRLNRLERGRKVS